ncbi:MAG: phosphate acyltransferase [Candidatus Hepatoplasma vulgare]|nr:MAG: phosphate acyltransferase [Candidatus Hepatoplasma sp.]
MIDKIIAFDLVSGDSGFDITYQAAEDFLKNNKDYKILAFIDKKNYIPDKYNKKIEFIICKDKINQSDGPIQIKRKPDSTLVRSIEAVINKKANFVVTAAGSGPTVIAGYLFSKPIKKGLKPAFAPIALDKNGKKKIMLDVGANLDANSDVLISYAKMGSEYIKALGISSNPRIRLLNIGIEDFKGTELLKETYNKLKKEKSLNFLGNMEANEILSEKEDIVLCDAVSGNIALKSYEGAFNLVYETIKKNAKSPFLKLKLATSPKLIKDLRKIMNVDDVGGAIVLGINDLIIKSHGSSDYRYFINSLNVGKKLYENNLIEKIKKVLDE